MFNKRGSFCFYPEEKKSYGEEEFPYESPLSLENSHLSEENHTQVDFFQFYGNSREEDNELESLRSLLIPTNFHF